MFLDPKYNEYNRVFSVRSFEKNLNLMVLRLCGVPTGIDLKSRPRIGYHWCLDKVSRTIIDIGLNWDTVIQ